MIWGALIRIGTDLCIYMPVTLWILLSLFYYNLGGISMENGREGVALVASLPAEGDKDNASSTLRLTD